MRIKRSEGPPPYFNTRDQFRMLKLVAALALVLVAIRVTSNPKMWHWMFPDAAVQEEPAAQQPAQDEGPIDRAVRDDEHRPLRSDEFLSRPNEPQAPAEPAEAAKPPAEGAPPEQAAAKPEQVAAPEATVLPPLVPGRVDVDPAVLEPVKDNTLGVRHDESDAYFRLLAQIRGLPHRALDQAARDDVSYTVLMVDPEHYRGQLVTVEGEIRRLLPFEATENRYGVKQLYDGWLFTAESGNNPYHIVCTSVPAGIPHGRSIRESVRVRVTGYFFKRESYATEDGLRLHSAPLILAKDMRRSLPPAAQQEEQSLVRYLVAFMAAVGAALAITLWRFRASDKRFERKHMKRLTEASPEAIAALKDVETTDVDEVFRRLSEEMQEAEAAAPPERAAEP
jgi:hypothetical protein